MRSSSHRRSAAAALLAAALLPTGAADTARPGYDLATHQLTELELEVRYTCTLDASMSQEGLEMGAKAELSGTLEVRGGVSVE